MIKIIWFSLIERFVCSKPNSPELNFWWTMNMSSILNLQFERLLGVLRHLKSNQNFVFRNCSSAVSVFILVNVCVRLNISSISGGIMENACSSENCQKWPNYFKCKLCSNIILSALDVISKKNRRTWIKWLICNLINYPFRFHPYEPFNSLEPLYQPQSIE